MNYEHTLKISAKKLSKLMLVNNHGSSDQDQGSFFRVLIGFLKSEMVHFQCLYF